MSSLPVLQYCGLSGRLNSASLRSGILSSYHHAKCSGDAKEAMRLWHQLTLAEREEVADWHVPTHVMVNDLIYGYDSAEKELEVALGPDGCAVDFNDPAALVNGHLDMAWAQGLEAVVIDIKRQRYTAFEGAESLQIAAYGRAFASMRGCVAYTPGIFVAMTGEWIIGKRVELESSEGEELWQRIKAAAENQARGEASTGPHCMKCFGRLKCPEFTLPVISNGNASTLAVVNGNPTPDQVAEALVVAKGMKDMAERILDAAKVYHDRGMVIKDKNGWEFRPTLSKGREYVNVGELKAGLGAEAKRFIRISRPRETWDWNKPKRFK
jgi:hypothetical protein